MFNLFFKSPAYDCQYRVEHGQEWLLWKVKRCSNIVLRLMSYATLNE